MYCSLKDGDRRRIVSPVDDSELVVTIKRDGTVGLDDYKEVLESKKIFIYAEVSKAFEVEVPEPYKILGESKVTIHK